MREKIIDIDCFNNYNDWYYTIKPILKSTIMKNIT